MRARTSRLARERPRFHRERHGDTTPPAALPFITEFNFLEDEETVDNSPTVLVQRKRSVEIAARLRDRGHAAAELDFDIGGGPLDKFIDVPPFLSTGTTMFAAPGGARRPHQGLRRRFCIDMLFRAHRCEGRLSARRPSTGMTSWPGRRPAL